MEYFHCLHKENIHLLFRLVSYLFFSFSVSLGKFLIFFSYMSFFLYFLMCLLTWALYFAI